MREIIRKIWNVEIERLKAYIERLTPKYGPKNTRNDTKHGYNRTNHKKKTSDKEDPEDTNKNYGQDNH